MKPIYWVALIFGWIGTLLLVATDDAVERAYAKYLILAALILALLPSLWGCSSPTAPTSTRTLVWAVAPKPCDPALPIPTAKRTEPLVTTKIPGDPKLTAVWLNADGSTLTVQFQAQLSGIFMICAWAEKK